MVLPAPAPVQLRCILMEARLPAISSFMLHINPQTMVDAAFYYSLIAVA